MGSTSARPSMTRTAAPPLSSDRGRRPKARSRRREQLLRACVSFVIPPATARCRLVALTFDDASGHAMGSSRCLGSRGGGPPLSIRAFELGGGPATVRAERLTFPALVKLPSDLARSALVVGPCSPGGTRPWRSAGVLVRELSSWRSLDTIPGGGRSSRRCRRRTWDDRWTVPRDVPLRISRNDFRDLQSS